MTPLQKATAQAIVNLFETGKIRGDYANVTMVVGDKGHLTYGRSQTTLASGNLYLLIADYAAAPGAAFATALKPYLERLKARDLTLDNDATLRGLLRQSGQDDPVMVRVQDAFFDRVYWQPATQSAGASGIATALGIAAVYDSTVHGAWRAMRDRTNQNAGTVATLGEKKWIAAYVATRRAWLAAQDPKTLLPKTVYRMDAFQALIDQSRWELELPLTVRGTTIRASDLEPAEVPVSADPDRILHLATPPMKGEDVKELQQALIARGYSLVADGAFGAKTDAAVKDFQKKKGLKADGVVGPVTRAALGM